MLRQLPTFDHLLSWHV